MHTPSTPRKLSSTAGTPPHTPCPSPRKRTYSISSVTSLGSSIQSLENLIPESPRPKRQKKARASDVSLGKENIPPSPVSQRTRRTESPIDLLSRRTSRSTPQRSLDASKSASAHVETASGSKDDRIPSLLHLVTDGDGGPQSQDLPAPRTEPQ